MEHFTHHTVSGPGGDLFYLTGGPAHGPLLIFVHGWPGAPETWQPQLEAFASLGFKVVAPANRGYSRSVVPQNYSDYSVEKGVDDLRAILDHLEAPRAVWIGHDWGSGPVWGLASHYPELCVGVVSLCIPYRTLEVGLLDGLLPYVNRNIYPVDESPYGQWDYQHFYEADFPAAIKNFDQDIDKSVKALFAAGSRAPFGTPSPTATVSKRGGWFGAAGPPDVPLEKTILSEGLYKTLTTHLKKTGFFGPSAPYKNHAANKEYAKSSVNAGHLYMPVLFVEARFDIVCDTALSTLAEPMREYCRNLTQCSIDAGHWVGLEKPHQTNAAIARWLLTSLPTYWPGYWNTPFTQQSK